MSTRSGERSTLSTIVFIERLLSQLFASRAVVYQTLLYFSSEFTVCLEGFDHLRSLESLLSNIRLSMFVIDDSQLFSVFRGVYHAIGFSG